MDILTRVTMKTVVKCDKSCEMQETVSHEVVERKLQYIYKNILLKF
jgi:hypothetical protein